MRTLLLLLLLLPLAALLTGCVVLHQRRLIYQQRHFTAAEARPLLPARAEPVAYFAHGGTHTAWYMPPADAPEPGAEPFVWMLFSGSGGVSTDWTPFIEDFPDRRVAFFVFDMPGYGANPGHPTPERIADAAVAAFDALAERESTTRERLANRSGTLGVSLGGATSLLFASRVPVRRVVLVATFTSMFDMARRRAGWLLANMLTQRFDNRARIRELAARSPAPRVAILHGTRDELIPESMSIELSTMAGPNSFYVPVPDAGHFDVLSRPNRGYTMKAMTDDPNADH